MISEELRVAVRVEAQNAINELNKLKATTSQNTMNFASMAKTLVGFGGVTAALIATKKIVIDNIKAGIDYAAALEKQTVAFEVLLGNADKAEEFMKQIQDFSASTPFQLPDLTSAAQRLLGFGTAAEEVVEVMGRLGDLSMGNSAVLDRLTLAYGKLQAKGKATLEELNMFTEAGVPLMQALADQLDVTGEELFQMVSRGEIGFEEVNRAIQNMTNEGGQFFEMTQRQAKTLSGEMSTLKDNLDIMKGAMVEALVDPLKEAVEWMTELAKKGTENARIFGLGMSLEENLTLARGRGFERLGLEDKKQLIEDILGGFEGQRRRLSIPARIGFDVRNKGTIAEFEAMLERLTAELEARAPRPTAPPTTGTSGSIITSATGAAGGGGITAQAGDMNAVLWAIDPKNGWMFPMPDNVVQQVKQASSATLSTMLGMGTAFGVASAGGGGAIGIAGVDTLAMRMAEDLYGAPGSGRLNNPLMRSSGSVSMNYLQGRGLSGLPPIASNAPPAFSYLQGRGLMGGGTVGPNPFAGVDFAGMRQGEEMAGNMDAFNNAMKQLDSLRQLTEVMDQLGESIKSAFSSEVVDAAFQFGQSLADGADAGLALGDAIQSFWQGMIQQLPQMLLAAAAQAAVAQQWHVAAGLLALSVGASIVAGAVSEAPMPSERAGAQTNIIVNGDINDADRFEQKVMNVVSRAQRAY